ncbi:hypothetical protein NDU88_006089 [Pleurodeles waltl]|uniref:Uncharacterized protein n=1 Tax=Pleurodeles waltl TaxID=8319 RepID=A0AAV7TXA3_PLEWA|nr:hypothetical protein NDU88_006089 [Pleurodeles waltl]
MRWSGANPDLSVRCEPRAVRRSLREPDLPPPPGAPAPLSLRPASPARVPGPPAGSRAAPAPPRAQERLPPGRRRKSRTPRSEVSPYGFPGCWINKPHAKEQYVEEEPRGQPSSGLGINKRPPWGYKVFYNAGARKWQQDPGGRGRSAAEEETIPKAGSA